MGLWGAAQSAAFAISGVAATLLVDVARLLSGSVPFAYAVVFVLEALLFLSASRLAARSYAVDGPAAEPAGGAVLAPTSGR